MEASDEIKAADARPGPRAPMGDNRSHADGPAAVPLVESMTKFALLELWCMVPGCTETAPFENRHRLQIHLNKRHAGACSLDF
jgi:hypothetical protein